MDLQDISRIELKSESLEREVGLQQTRCRQAAEDFIRSKEQVRTAAKRFEDIKERLRQLNKEKGPSLLGLKAFELSAKTLKEKRRALGEASRKLHQSRGLAEHALEQLRCAQGRFERVGELRAKFARKLHLRQAAAGFEELLETRLARKNMPGNTFSKEATTNLDKKEIERDLEKAGEDASRPEPDEASRAWGEAGKGTPDTGSAQTFSSEGFNNLSQSKGGGGSDPSSEEPSPGRRLYSPEDFAQRVKNLLAWKGKKEIGLSLMYISPSGRELALSVSSIEEVDGLQVKIDSSNFNDRRLVRREKSRLLSALEQSGLKIKQLLIDGVAA
jgi:hypothetical protein